MFFSVCLTGCPGKASYTRVPSFGCFPPSKITKVSKFPYLFENTGWYTRRSLKNMPEDIIKAKIKFKFITLL